MRIIGGAHKGRKLSVPKGRESRPTTDRVRESLFNTLEHGAFLPAGLEGLRVLDLFAGTGALGLEALSRGAVFACFVESAPGPRACLERNIDILGVRSNTALLHCDATRLVPVISSVDGPFDLAFLDPPYARNLGQGALASMLKNGWLTSQAIVIYEMARSESAPDGTDFTTLDERLYGKTKISFLRAVHR